MSRIIINIRVAGQSPEVTIDLPSCYRDGTRVEIGTHVEIELPMLVSYGYEDE